MGALMCDSQLTDITPTGKCFVDISLTLINYVNNTLMHTPQHTTKHTTRNNIYHGLYWTQLVWARQIAHGQNDQVAQITSKQICF
jgi:hypothetical protein